MYRIKIAWKTLVVEMYPITSDVSITGYVVKRTKPSGDLPTKQGEMIWLAYEFACRRNCVKKNILQSLTFVFEDHMFCALKNKVKLGRFRNDFNEIITIMFLTQWASFILRLVFFFLIFSWLFVTLVAVKTRLVTINIAECNTESSRWFMHNLMQTAKQN